MERSERHRTPTIHCTELHTLHTEGTSLSQTQSKGRCRRSSSSETQKNAPSIWTCSGRGKLRDCELGNPNMAPQPRPGLTTLFLGRMADAFSQQPEYTPSTYLRLVRQRCLSCPYRRSNQAFKPSKRQHVQQLTTPTRQQNREHEQAPKPSSPPHPTPLISHRHRACPSLFIHVVPTILFSSSRSSSCSVCDSIVAAARSPSTVAIFGLNDVDP